MVPHGLTADGALTQKQLGEQVGVILQELSEVLREVFVLRFLEEKSYEEIGDILHLNPNTVATRIRRARTEFVERAKRVGLGLEGGE
ncbi:MAG: Sigma-70, region 4 [Fibrobacterota bacterium]